MICRFCRRPASGGPVETWCGRRESNPRTDDLQVLSIKELSEESGQSSQIASQNLGVGCPRLRKIVEAWEALPESLKAGVLAIIETHHHGQ